MTVISALKLNPEEAVLVTDEQVSFRGRKADLVTKVVVFNLADNFKAIVAGSGSVNYFDAVIPLVQRSLQQVPENGYDFAREFSHNLVNVRHRAIDGYFKGQLGISEIEMQSGHRIIGNEKIPIAPDFIQSYRQLLQNPDLNVRSLILTSKDGKVDLYECDNNTTDVDCMTHQFRVIGSGTDAAEMELTSFIESRTREKRLTISRSEGLTAILHATDLARIRNIGVGGTPNIYLCNKGEIINPCEANSHLAVEIVRATNAGYLPKEFEAEVLIRLLYEQAPVDDGERVMWEKVPKNLHTEFSRFLRGYKK